MKWRCWALGLHRDLGYFFTGVVIVYAISGLAVNHAADWDSSFVIERTDLNLDLPTEPADVNDEVVLANLRAIGEAHNYKAFDFPSRSKIKIYLQDGSIMARLSDGRGTYETIRRRPVLYDVNRLHLNPTAWWRLFSDVFAVCLILIAMTGILLPKGRKGLAGRGKWLVGAGLLVPLAAIAWM